MATQPQRAKLTFQDYLLLPEDGKRHEIINGEEYVSPSPRVRHQDLSLRLSLALGNYLAARPIGRVLVAPMDVVLSPEDVVQPDLLFVRAERRAIITDKNIQGAPDLAIEIVSEGLRERDEILKRKRYEHFAVGEYWVVDPALGVVKVYRMENGRYHRAAELSAEAGDALTSPLLPEFRLELAGLFAPAD